jgi:thiamine pyrophosphate-dependent enzyme
MATTAADVLVKGLIDWGVDTVFGIPGDGINGIMEALRQRQKEIRFIQVRHEETAAFMDPNEPPLPPKASFAQTRHMIEALVRGTPDGAKIAKQLAKDTIRQLI